MKRFRFAKEGPRKVKTVDEALDLMEQGESVELEEEGDVNTLLDKLADVASNAKSGKDYELCAVTVPGTNLFCGDSLGVKRAEMPQLGGMPKEGSEADKLPKNKKGEVNAGDQFVKHLEDKGTKVKEKKMSASSLKPSQGQLVGSNIAGMLKSAKDGSYDPGKEPIFVSRDGYVVDGHHRWAAIVAMDIADDGKLNQSVEMNVREIDMNISDVLKEANAFADEFGILPKEGVKEKKKEEYSPVIVPPGAEEKRKEKQEAETPEAKEEDSDAKKGDKVKGTDKNGDEYEGEIISMSFGKPKIKTDGGEEVTLVDYKTAKTKRNATNWNFDGQPIADENLVYATEGDEWVSDPVVLGKHRVASKRVAAEDSFTFEAPAFIFEELKNLLLDRKPILSNKEEKARASELNKRIKKARNKKGISGTGVDGNDIEGTLVKMIFGKPKVLTESGEEVMLHDWEKSSSKKTSQPILSNVIYVAKQDRDDYGLVTVVQDWGNEVSIQALRTGRVVRMNKQKFNSVYELNNDESEFALFL